ncbi:MAG: DUF1501 domain-containing protein [Planctomycetaceae bacterium]|jgi:hypothetical protein
MDMQSDNMTRRHVLSTMSALGLSLSLTGVPSRAADHRKAKRMKSVITLWMDGGMSQLESWDPHPNTPSSDDVRAIATTVDGLQISEFLPQMAEQMHRTTVIRSLTSEEGDHERGTFFVKTGYRLDPTLTYPALGAIAASQLPDPTVEIPQHICLGTNQFWPGGGYLGNQWDAFRVFDPGRSQANLKSAVNENRQRKRLSGLDVLNRTFDRGRPTAERDSLHQKTMQDALRMMSSEQLRAFELDDEPTLVQSRYGDSRFGRGCLVARRLVETGVRAVEVSLGGFDTHVSNLEGHRTQLEILDPAFATLLQDLSDRDLLESTVVLCIGEFGRTPQLNPAAGRDHWPHWFSCVVAGGGFRAGHVAGATPGLIPRPRRAGEPKPKPNDPVSVPQLYATILQTMGIPWDEEIMTPVGRPMRLTESDPLPSLLRDR